MTLLAILGKMKRKNKNNRAKCFDREYPKSLITVLGLWQCATKGGRIPTTDICALCFSEDNLVMPEDIEKERDVRGKIPLPTCRLCMNLQVEIPCAAGRKVDYHKQEKHKKKRKEIELQNHVRKKKRKMRK